jgi:hypothetical protein
MSIDANGNTHRPAGTRGGQFAAQARTEPDVTLPAAVPDLYGGFRLTKVRTFRGRDGDGFSAVLTENARPVAEVVNEGNGGASFVRFTDGPRSAPAVRFAAAGKVLAPDAVEPDEDLVWRLVTVEEMNRKRAVAFVFDGDDFWTTGQHRQCPASMKLADAVGHLSRPGFEGRHPQVWDRVRGDFVPVDQVRA